MSYTLCLLEQFIILMKHKKLQHFFLITLLTITTLLLSIILVAHYNGLRFLKKINESNVIIITWNKDYNGKIKSTLYNLKKNYNIQKIKIYSPQDAFFILTNGQQELSYDSSTKLDQILPYTAIISTKEDRKKLIEIENLLKKQPGIKKVIINTSNIDIINSVKTNYIYFLVATLILLLFTCGSLTYSYFYILKLSRAKELSILQLMGASNVFIIVPFTLKGIITGLLASLLGILLTKILVLYLNILLNTPPLWLKIEMLPISYCVLITLGIVLISFLGSFLAVNPYFRKGD